jgi:cell division septal protein FtsQ
MSRLQSLPITIITTTFLDHLSTSRETTIKQINMSGNDTYQTPLASRYASKLLSIPPKFQFNLGHWDNVSGAATF